MMYGDELFDHSRMVFLIAACIIVLREVCNLAGADGRFKSVIVVEKQVPLKQVSHASNLDTT